MWTFSKIFFNFYLDSSFKTTDSLKFFKNLVFWNQTFEQLDHIESQAEFVLFYVKFFLMGLI